MKRHKTHSDELNWCIAFNKANSLLRNRKARIRKKNDKRRRKLFAYMMKRWGSLPLIPEFEINFAKREEGR